MPFGVFGLRRGTHPPRAVCVVVDWVYAYIHPRLWIMGGPKGTGDVLITRGRSDRPDLFQDSLRADLVGR